MLKSTMCVNTSQPHSLSMVGKAIRRAEAARIASSTQKENIIRKQRSTRKFADFFSELEDSKSDVRDNPTRFVNNINLMLAAL